MTAIEPLQPEHQHLRELAETIQEVFWLASANNAEMLYVSPGYERIFGRSCAALRADVRDWLNAVHPEDRARMAELTASPATTTREERFRIVRPGGAVRIIELKTFPVCEHGEVVRRAGMASDVTERCQLEAQLHETQKLESLGLLAGGIAHDFNNILAVVAANASFLRDTLPADHPELDVLDEIAVAVDRGAALTCQLLAFSRKQAVDPQALDLNAIVNDTSKMLRRMVGEDVIVTTQLGAGLGSVKIDPGGVVQILMNLVVNARDAMPGGGALAISTLGGAGASGEVVLVVADTGCGMSPEVRARAFEPLFTTKAAGRGTGLGLSVVHGIVKQAGGRIEIDSQPGAGTTIRIALPVCAAREDRAVRTCDRRTGGHEKLILVEDDRNVRCSLARALRSHGYEVIEAGDGPAALKLLDADGKRVDLLVTDVVMPGMSGRQLVDAARRGRPTLRVLYISGYAEDSVQRHGAEWAGGTVLEKPFPADALAARVREILDEAKLRTLD